MVTLTKAEERIMQILWDLEKGFIKDILEQFPDPKPPYNTVATIVRVLEKKEIISYKSYGGAHQFYPLISREKYRNEQLGSLVKDYFGNSLKEVVHFLSEKKDLDVKDVNEVMKILEDIRKKREASQ
jgi:predicted transcriptional regulator